MHEVAANRVAERLTVHFAGLGHSVQRLAQILPEVAIRTASLPQSLCSVSTFNGNGLPSSPWRTAHSICVNWSAANRLRNFGFSRMMY